MYLIDYTPYLLGAYHYTYILILVIKIFWEIQTQLPLDEKSFEIHSKSRLKFISPEYNFQVVLMWEHSGASL